MIRVRQGKAWVSNSKALALRERARRRREEIQQFGVEPLEARYLLTATVLTDQLDYAPGSTAIFTATSDGGPDNNYLAGETVQFQVTRTDGIEDFPPSNQPWQVADGVSGFEPYQDLDGMWHYPDTDGQVDGNVGTTWYVDPQYAGASLLLTATG